jgi:hypothetical protein
MLASSQRYPNPEDLPMKLTAFALAAAATLGACSMMSPPTTTPSTRLVTNVNALQPGSGVVQNVMPAPVMADAAASSTEPMRRLEIKMSNGRTQYVDTTSTDIARGDRVQIGADGVISRG